MPLMPMLLLQYLLRYSLFLLACSLAFVHRMCVSIIIGVAVVFLRYRDHRLVYESVNCCGFSLISIYKVSISERTHTQHSTAQMNKMIDLN